jgi:hypothetical protein
MAAAAAVACTAEDPDDALGGRSIDALHTGQVEADSVSPLLSGARHVVALLSDADTTGLGSYLHPEFRWQRFPQPTGSPTRVRGPRPDNNYFERLHRTLPLLAPPLPTEFEVARRGDDHALVIGYESCGLRAGCQAGARVLLEWRRSPDGWKVATLHASGPSR